ncbi:hypothetical protein HDV06_003431 [Boothiomyces sp. JEL0866]|nr:hypothetical protein HDV06_003383 [Boothiomyces sp. JEL0866]KAJ3325661.1 hypothetical protein HDV06_003431 [Boothiomyces sp. JEL0866]
MTTAEQQIPLGWVEISAAFNLHFSQYESIIVVVATLLGMTGSILLIKNKLRYHISNTDFGNIILLVSYCDLLYYIFFISAFILAQLPIFYSQNSTFLSQFIWNTTLALGSIVTYTSLYLGMSIALISFYIVFMLGSAQMVNWKVILSVSLVFPTIHSVLYYYVFPFVYHSMNDDSDSPSIAMFRTFLLYTLIGAPIWLSAILYVVTLVKLKQRTRYQQAVRFMNIRISEKEYANTIMMKIIQTLTVSNLIAWGPLTFVWLINVVISDSTTMGYLMLLPGITVQSKGLVHYLSLCYVFRDEEEKKLPKSIQHKPEKDDIDSLVLHLKKPAPAVPPPQKITLGESETSLPSDIQEIIQEFKPKTMNMNKISLGDSDNSWNSL